MTQNDLVPPRPTSSRDEVRNPYLTSSRVPFSRRDEDEVEVLGQKTTQKELDLVPKEKPVDNSAKSPYTLTMIPSECNRCGSKIWLGLSDLRMNAKLDPELLSIRGQMAACAACRDTYSIHKSGRGFEADYRTANRIAWSDPDQKVLASHVCNPDLIRTELPNYWPTATYQPTEEPRF